MKTSIKLGVGVVMAAMIIPVVMVNGAQASRVVTFGNGSTYTVNRQGGGDVQKTYTGANGTTVTYSRTCANGECTAVLK